MEADLIICSHCRNVYDIPVVLPCGNTICKKDLKELNNKCKFCLSNHSINIDNCPVNNLIQNMVDKCKLNKLKLARLNFKLKEYTDAKNNTVLLKSDHFRTIRNNVLSTYDELSYKLIDMLKQKYDEFIKQIDVIEDDFNNQINSNSGIEFQQQIEKLEKMNANRIETSELNHNIDAIQTKINSFEKIKNEINKYEFKSNEIEISINFNLTGIAKRSDVNVGASTSKQATLKSNTNDDDEIHEVKCKDKKRSFTDSANASVDQFNDTDDDCKIITTIKRKKNKKSDQLIKEKMSKVINKIINNAGESSEEELIDYLCLDSDEEKQKNAVIFNESDSDSFLDDSRTSNADETDNE